jgi:hypothetical protein
MLSVVSGLKGQLDKELNGMTEHVHFVPVEGAGMIVLVDGQTKK